jgi:hypothetical protein
MRKRLTITIDRQRDSRERESLFVSYHISFSQLKFVQVACAHCLLEKSYDPEWYKLHELELLVAKVEG